VYALTNDAPDKNKDESPTYRAIQAITSHQIHHVLHYDKTPKKKYTLLAATDLHQHLTKAEMRHYSTHDETMN
jgi:hypothetical protein